MIILGSFYYFFKALRRNDPVYYLYASNSVIQVICPYFTVIKVLVSVNGLLTARFVCYHVG